MKGWQKAVLLAGAIGVGAVGYLLYKKVHAIDPLKEEFRKMGDVNRDGIIDDKDIDLIKAAYASYPGHPNWNPDCDLNGDGKVNLADMVIAASNYGLTFEEWLKTRGLTQTRFTKKHLPIIKEI